MSFLVNRLTYLASDHQWKKDDEGEVDWLALSGGDHNGPECEVCGRRFCEHCTPNPGPCPGPSKYPEHEKLSARSQEHAAISAFVEWLVEGEGVEGLTICRAVENPAGYYDRLRWEPVNAMALTRLIAEYFEVDHREFEREKERMLKEIRETRG